MAGSLNKAIVVGNVVRDPEVRQTPDGRKIVNLSVATSEQWKDKNTGERREKAEFHRVVIFNERLAGVAEQYMKKGTKVYLEGQLQTRKWTDQSGQDRYITEIVLGQFRGELLLLDRAGGAANDSFGGDAFEGSGTGSSDRASGSGGGEMSKSTASTLKEDLADFDDDIPF